VVIAAVAITLAISGSLSHTSGRDSQRDPGSAFAGASPSFKASTEGRGRTPSTTAVHTPVTAAVLALRSALDRRFRSAGPASGAVVYDLSDHRQLYALYPEVKRPPASLEKLFTTVALMRVLGPDARLHTDVLGTGRLARGIWHGDLYLRGGGDPTFGDATFNRFYELGYGPTAAQLVSQLEHQGIRRVTGQVYADESLLDRRRGGLMTGYAPDVPDFGGQLSALVYDHGTSSSYRVSPAEFAVRQLVTAMKGLRILARAAQRPAPAPGGARQLASVNSPPLSVMTRLMNVPSDDLFAELLTKQLGVLFGGGGSIAAGARVISRTIAASYDLHPTILDGSGLSRNDRSSPLEVVALLRDVWHTAVGDQLAASLPTVGVEGTVRTIGLKTAAQGNCIAKTGTLNYVSNLAGYCRSRGGHMLAFALLIDGPPNYTAIPLESKIVGAIARY